MCVCSLRYTAFSAHAPYCHLWPVKLYSMFSHYLIKGTALKKLNFSLQILCEPFLILRRTERDMIKNVHWSSCKAPLVLSGLMKLEFCRQIFGKYSNILKILPVGAELFQWKGSTDIKKLIVAFHNFANEPKSINSYLTPLYELHEV